MTLPPMLMRINLAIAEFWQARNERERKQLALALAVALFALVYMVLIEPAYLGRQQMKKNLPALRQQAAELQALSKDAVVLANVTVPMAPDMTREGVEAAIARAGMSPQNVAVTGNLAKVQLSSVSFAAMVTWLDEMQKSSRISVLDANITAQAQRDTVNATLTLRQQKSEQ